MYRTEIPYTVVLLRVESTDLVFNEENQQIWHSSSACVPSNRQQQQRAYYCKKL